MKKKTWKLLALTLVLSLCITGVLYEFRKAAIDPAKYSSYRCYDYHLKSLKVSRGSAQTEISFVEEWSGVEQTKLANFRTIPGESDDMFVFALVMYPFVLDLPDKVVMQNPNHYVDIWEAWTVEKIELYYTGGKDPTKQDESANIPDAVISVTSETGCLSDIKQLVKSRDELVQADIPEGKGYKYRWADRAYWIRVHFKESKNIVWDARVEWYYSSEIEDTIICIDLGKEPQEISTMNAKEVNISNYTGLFDWIVASLNSN